MPDPHIGRWLQTSARPLLSFEFFPPRDETGRRNFEAAARNLLAAAPDFVTVTCGAGGLSRERTLEVCDGLRAGGYGPVMPHVTCAGIGREGIERETDEIVRRGYRNVMALRGDPPAGGGPPAGPDGFPHASDLVAFFRERDPDLCCGVAGYPETHPESPSPGQDVQFLKWKLMAGASFVTTQLFFDNRVYFDFVGRCRRAGIFQPILPGLLPAVSLPQAKRMCAMCGVRLPDQLEVDLQDAGGTGPAAEAVGIRWTASQIRDLLGRGAPGVHLYILNRSRIGLAPELIRCFTSCRARPEPAAPPIPEPPPWIRC